MGEIVGQDNVEITRLWKSFHHDLRSHIVKRVRSEDDADDVLQDVFLRILKKSTVVLSAQNVTQYLYGIVRNAIADYFRQSRPTGELPDDLMSEEEEQTLNHSIAECCVRPFINRLPEKYKEALELTEFDQVSQTELAERLGISYSGAKSRVQRGREQLKNMIQQCCSIKSDRYGNLSS